MYIDTHTGIAVPTWFGLPYTVDLDKSSLNPYTLSLFPIPVNHNAYDEENMIMPRKRNPQRSGVQGRRGMPKAAKAPWRSLRLVATLLETDGIWTSAFDR